ncbi:MAG TPA: MBG domain-containing protein, partial [Verrucomicrobiae bacterium]
PYSTNFPSLYDGDSVSGNWVLYANMVGATAWPGTVTNWILNLVLANAPVVTLDSAVPAYAGSTTNLNASCLLTDADNWDFAGGSLTVQITNNAAAEDVLVVNPQGTTSGQIGLSGTAVTYSGTNFGYYTGGGNGTTPLVIYFTNSAASVAAVQAHYTRIAYTNATVTSTNNRTQLFTLNDGLNGTNYQSKTLMVSNLNHAPVVALALTNQTATYGSAFSYTFPTNTFTDTDTGQTLTYSASGSVLTNSGLGFNAATRTFAATLLDATNGGTISGSWTILVTATDNGTPTKSVTTNFTLTINKAAAAITTSNAARVYGGSNPTLTGSTIGFLAADNISTAYTTTANTNSAPGSYGVTPVFTDSGNRLGNYSLTTNSGALTISKATLVATAAGAARAYGSTNPVFTVSYSGFTNGQSLATSDVTGSPAMSTGATTNSNVGAYVITNSAGTLTSGNYSLNFVNGTLTITQAVLTVTASNYARVYGGLNPTFAAGYTGFLNGQTLANSGVSGAPNLVTGASTNSGAGSYPITNSLGTLTANNYGFNLLNGTLTVTQAILTISADTLYRGYGATNPV